MRFRVLTQGPGALSAEEVLVLVDLATAALNWQASHSPEDRQALCDAIAELRRLGGM